MTDVLKLIQQDPNVSQAFKDVLPSTASDVSRPNGLLAAHADLIARLSQLRPNVIVGIADARGSV